MECITTYTGEDFTPLAPKMEQIKIEDIAHALSMLCRANGHFKRFYSVAQHSINCAGEAAARRLPAKVQLACLLHDASEAYLSDITRPVKTHLPDYQRIEARLQNMIYVKYLTTPLAEDDTARVKEIDHAMLHFEFNHLMIKKVFDCVADMRSKPSLDLRSFAEVKDEFISLFNALRKIS
jgi:hypothetical protein